MSTRANPVVIGGFVVGAVALLVVALLVWGGTGLFRTKLDYVLFFDSAVTGLNKGGPVLGRGVKVGEVTDVQVRWGTPLVAVYVTLEPQALKGAAEEGPSRAIERLVRDEGLRAQLRMQSFVTGVLYVALDFRPDTPIVFRGGQQRVPEIPTIPSDIEVWTAKLERFAKKIEKVPLDEIGQNVEAILEDVKGIVESKGTRDLLPNANLAVIDGPRARSRWRRRRLATPGHLSRTCAASRPNSVPRSTRCWIRSATRRTRLAPRWSGRRSPSETWTGCSTRNRPWASSSSRR
jgi:paraquat-inducible protein B